MSITEQQSLHLGKYENLIRAGLAKLADENFGDRISAKDPTLWKMEPDIQAAIRNRLGWLDVVEYMRGLTPSILDFVSEVRAAGFKYALLLGMGGSSLCPEVMRLTFGVKEGYLDLAVLDSTEPGMVLARERAVDLEKTLFFVCSKSGTTAEINAFYHYFYEKVKEIKGDKAGENFVAITDPGTILEEEARKKGFRSVFINPPDIGGRYSALSYFGLVPAATIGVDIKQLLDRAQELSEMGAAGLPLADRPGILLGNAIGQLALAGRNKLTFVTSKPIASFGDWVEQLVAESTGKEGKGIVPVVGEPLGAPETYGNDRVFVYLELAPGDNPNLTAQLQALEKAGHPVIRIRLRDKLDLGREYYRWEVATAAAGAVLGVNPFDEPNVKESKDNTNALLKEFREKGALPEGEPALVECGIELYCDEELLAKLAESASERFMEGTLTAYLSGLIRLISPGDYFALMAFLPSFNDISSELQGIRMAVRNGCDVATTLGFGPRFLHSTGQLHKGGPNTGVFIQITQTPVGTLPIPGEPFDFGTLVTAQALGDFRSLENWKRRAVRLHIKDDAVSGLQEIRVRIEEILKG